MTHRQHSFRLLALALLLAAALGPAAPARAIDTMTPGQLQTMSEAEIEAWARGHLGPHEAAIIASAQRNRVPPRLLATIILNELADYGRVDQAQELIFNRGSVGMAQINVDTAIGHRLVDVSEAEIERSREELARQADVFFGDDPMGISQPTDPATINREEAVAHATWRLLNDPTVAIEAAAREIKGIFDQVNANPGHTYPASLLGGPIDPLDPYANVLPKGPRQTNQELLQIDREEQLARLIAAAYNSPAIIIKDFDPNDPRFFANARTHGDNAANFFAALLASREWYGRGRPMGPANPPVTPPAAGSPRSSVVILLDASGSMAEPAGGGTRMEEARRSALRTVGQMTGDVEVALMVFYDCGSIVVEVPFTRDPAPLRARLEGNAIQPSGSTPLAAGIGEAKGYLRDNAASADRRLVVLTDGEESCGGDLVGAARG